MAVPWYIRYIPYVFEILGDLILLICAGVAVQNDRDFGGIAVPFVADTANYKPEYYIYAIGMTVVAVTFFFVTIFNSLSHFRVESLYCKMLAMSMVLIGIIAAISLAISAIVSTGMNYNVNNQAFLLFFCAMLVWCCLDLTAINLRRDKIFNYFLVQLITLILLLISFLICVPIGYGLVYSHECNMVGSASDRYSDCEKTQLMRSITTYITFALMLWYGGNIKFFNFDPLYKDDPV